MKKSAALPPLLESIRFYFNILSESSNAYYFIMDLNEGVTLISKNWVSDFDMGSAVLKDIDEVWIPKIHPGDRDRFITQNESLFIKHETTDHNISYRAKNRNGEYVWLKGRGKLLRDEDGKAYFFGGIMSRMDRLNQADKITGLLNKSLFEKKVSDALENYHKTGIGGRIMIFGLDNFKAVNETYNRSFGDVILRVTAQQIMNILPPEVTLYRLDGDEFAAVLPGAGNIQVSRIFKSIQKCMARRQSLDGNSYFCTVSAGTVPYPEGGRDYLSLHKHAEAALALAKRDGKNQNVIFSDEQYNRWMRQLALRDMLKTSVEEGFTGFKLFYQPQVDAATKKLIGAEALLRWYDPDGKMVSPLEIIPILEETKLIIPLGKWIVREALKTCKKWRETIPHFHMSVNMSYVQIKDEKFFPFVSEAMAESGLPQEAMTLELTESTIVSDWTFLNQQFDEFRRLGMHIAMDDFGTGYSSLAYLKNLSCDIVKVDRAFIKNILDNEFDARLVEYTVTLCHSVGINVCIEGVEDHEVYELVTNKCGADYIQGYFFGKPEPETVFEEKFLTTEALAG